MKEIKSNGLEDIISQAIEEMKSEQGNNFSLERINLAELERRTGISRAKLRRLKANNFNQKAHGLVAYAGPVVQAFRRSWCNDSGHVVHAFR